MLLIPGEPIVVLTVAEDGTVGSQPSGAPAIAAWAAAKLGAPTAFVGAVGDDVAGALMRDTLTAAGADADAVVVKPDGATATATVRYLRDGSRKFAFNVAASAATALVPADLRDFPERAAWVHVSGSAVLFGGTLADTIEAAVERGKRSGATVSVDPNLRAELGDSTLRRRVARLCEAADILFPSDGELEALGLDEDMVVAAGGTVCHTSAEAGARIRDGDLDERVPAVASVGDVVDPDGAGDTFAAAVIAARLRGLGWAAAVGAAARVVAHAISVSGPMTADFEPGELDLAARQR